MYKRQGKAHVPVVFHFLVAGDVDAGGSGDVFPVPQGEHEFLFPATALQRLGVFIAMPYLFDNVVLAPCHNDFIFYDLLRYIGEVFDLSLIHI